MSLKFLSKTLDLLSQTISTDTLSVSQSSEVIIKVTSVIWDAGIIRQGTGQVVSAGKDYLKLIGRTVEYFIPLGSTQLKEFEVCDGKLCLISKNSILMHPALTALMLSEYISSINPRYIVHVSSSEHISKYLNFISKDQKIDLITINKPSNSAVLNMINYDMLLVGDLNDDFIFEEITPKNSMVLQYSYFCDAKIIHRGTFIKQSVFDWFAKLTFFTRKQLLYYIEYNKEVFVNDIKTVGIEEVMNDDIEELVQLNLDDCFSNKLEYFRRKSVDTRRMTNSGVPSMTCSIFENNFQPHKSNVTSIDEIVNPNCLNSPKPNFYESTNSEDTVAELIELSQSGQMPNDTFNQDTALIDHLSQLIVRYANKSVMQTLKNLSSFFPKSEKKRNIFVKFLEDDQSVYRGEMNENRNPEGFGNRYFSDGTVFRGNWKNGQAFGKGIMASPEGILYVGEWKKGVFHGYGSLLISEKLYREGYFRKGELNGFGFEVLHNGEKYHGTFMNDLRHDRGELTLTTGEKFLVTYDQGIPIEQRLSKSLEGFQIVDSLNGNFSLDGTSKSLEGLLEYGESCSASSACDCSESID